MQNFDDFYFHSKHAPKPDTIEHLKTAILNEYLSDLSSQKLLKSSSLPLCLTFADLTSWIYQKTYSSSSGFETKKLWNVLSKGDDIEELKFDEFFKNYAEALYETHQKMVYLRRKSQKILKLKKRTMKYLESLEYLLRELGCKGSEQGNRLVEGGHKCNFLINVDTLENFEMGNIFKDNEYLGHHIELGYKDAVVFTPTQSSNGRLVNFGKIQLGLNLDFMVGNIFINVYEDFLRETRIDKTLVARRNLDLFSSLSRGFIVKTLLKELRDEALMQKFTGLFEELAFEEDERAEEDPENNFKLLKEDGKFGVLDNATHTISHNFTQELLESEKKTERFKLCKVNNPIHNPYVYLRLYISCDNLKSLDDLGQYRELMELRREFLSHKVDKSIKKIHFYKSTLKNLTISLRGIIATDNEIRVDRKFLRSQLQSLGMSYDNFAHGQKRTCTLF